MLPAIAFAQLPSIPQKNITTPREVLAIVEKAVSWIFAFFFAVVAFYILSAAYTYLTAGGDPAKLASAKNKLIYAAVGIALALVARSAIAVIENFI